MSIGGSGLGGKMIHDILSLGEKWKVGETISRDRKWFTRIVAPLKFHNTFHMYCSHPQRRTNFGVGRYLKCSKHGVQLKMEDYCSSNSFLEYST